MMFSILLLGVLLIILFFLYKHFTSTFQILKNNGIDGPEPTIFFGNYRERMEVGTLKYLHQIHGKYGKIVGLYLGRLPKVFITDVELMKLIFVKDFDNFIDRPSFPGTFLPEGLTFAKGGTWRSMRRIITPTFSTLKMKAMVPLMLTSVETLVDVFRGHADTDKSFECFRTYGAFTMESIFAAAFGRMIEIQKGQSDPLVQAALAIFTGARENQTSSFIFWQMVLSNFPWLSHVLGFINQWTPRAKAFQALHNAAQMMIHQRRQMKDSGKYKDLLQLMIDATAEGEEEQGMRNKLTDYQVIGNAITFMLAGYETTAITLSNTSYLLALNPHVQEKLQKMIDTYMEEHPDASHYQAVQDLEYLDMVVQESLRLFPPIPVSVRHVIKDYSYNGITIPKGSAVHFPSNVLHMDPQFWKDPETFNPLRFTAEEKAKRPQITYIPFGYGPRNCIGMRFAVLETKIAMLELLKSFSFVRAPDTQVPMETVFGFSTVPKNGTYLKVVTRNGQ